MSLNAGGGNLGMIFSTLTYSVMLGGLVGDVMEERGVFRASCCWLQAKLLEKSRQGPR